MHREPVTDVEANISNRTVGFRRQIVTIVGGNDHVAKVCKSKRITQQAHYVRESRRIQKKLPRMLLRRLVPTVLLTVFRFLWS